MEEKIKITKLDVLGPLPDPFLGEDGKRISDPSQWPARRREIYKHAVDLQYGTQPPKPEVLKVDCTYRGKNSHTYRITAGTKEKTVSFYMRVFLPAAEGIWPAVIDGDACFDYGYSKEFIRTLTDENITFVFFNRTELANDIQHEGRRKGPLYEVYPEYTFGALGAWAWGYSRCVDALEQIGIADLNHITFTGHSRGGKTAALAGVLDERAEIVNPNATCAGACSCYRVHMRAIREDGVEKPSETLADLIRNFDFWMGEGMGDYTQREQDLPFDCHMLKAMVAPRTLFVSEAVSDIWSSPAGSYLTSIAAKEVFDFLDVPENLLWYFRDGYHYHEIEDLQMLVNVIKNKTEGRPLNDRFFRLPFAAPAPIHDWKCPEK